MPGLDQPLELARALIRCPSVTPADEGALDVLQSDVGFADNISPSAGVRHVQLGEQYRCCGSRAASPSALQPAQVVAWVQGRAVL